jgi:two-component system response regulator RegA
MTDGPELKKLRILIVDDDHGSNSVMAIALRRRGYDCAIATTVSDATSAIAAYRPDVVLLEWMLARGAGRGLTRRLRVLSLAQSLVVIVVSTQDESPEFRSEEDINAYFVKPVKIDSLVRALHNVSGSTR